MRVRIRVGKGQRVRREGSRNRRIAQIAAALLTPFSLMAFVLGTWRLGADLRLTGEFAIESGPFSHWQVWIAVSIVLQTGATLLNRYGETAEEERE